MTTPPYPYRETYRGIGFHLTSKGFWIFDDVPPNNGYWTRYFKDGEEECAESMRRAIDRYHANTPVFTGDLRYRLNGC